MASENIRLAETLLFLLQEIRSVEQRLKALTACLLANSPSPAVFQAQIADAEKMWLEIHGEDEKKLQHFEEFLDILKSGKNLDEHDA